MTDFGWTLTGIDAINNLKGQNQCSRTSFHSYQRGAGSGILEYTFSESASIELKVGDCWNQGNVAVYINGAEIARIPPFTMEVLTRDVNSGDRVEVKDEDGNAVMQVEYIKVCAKVAEGIVFTFHWDG